MDNPQAGPSILLYGIKWISRSLSDRRAYVLCVYCECGVDAHISLSDGRVCVFLLMWCRCAHQSGQPRESAGEGEATDRHTTGSTLRPHIVDTWIWR